MTSSPQLDFQNTFAKLAGTVDLTVRGTVAEPSILGRIQITDGSATFAGTKYELQRGDIYFSNPVRIDPTIDIDATARVETYDITVGLQGTMSNLKPTYRSEPPLSEADIFALLALGRTQEEAQLYQEQEVQQGANPTTSALLGGALNATVSNRIGKLFGGGTVKIDPAFVGTLGNSTARITVQKQLSRQLCGHLCDQRELHGSTTAAGAVRPDSQCVAGGAARRVGRVQRGLQDPPALPVGAASGIPWLTTYIAMRHRCRATLRPDIRASESRASQVAAVRQIIRRGDPVAEGESEC